MSRTPLPNPSPARLFPDAAALPDTLHRRYFTHSIDVLGSSPADQFRVYLRPTKGLCSTAGLDAGVPTLLHCAARLVLLLHGAGVCALSWAPCAAELAAMSFPDDTILAAVDLRCHGATSCADESPSSLTLGCVADDVASVILRLREIANTRQTATTNASSPQLNPGTVVLVGHSFGGAVAVDVAARNLVPGLIGVAVLDVVEAAALAALPSMSGVLAARPKGFGSIREAIEWSIRKRASGSPDAAAVSVPHMLTRVEPDSDGCGGHFAWRTNLAATEELWHSWFTGLTEKFVTMPCARLLLVGDRSSAAQDTPLTIAHMQGKFQLIVLDAGHMVHEELPKKVAEALAEFNVRSTPLTPAFLLALRSTTDS